MACSVRSGKIENLEKRVFQNEKWTVKKTALLVRNPNRLGYRPTDVRNILLHLRYYFNIMQRVRLIFWFS